jgi:hypothetical protein
MHDALSLTEGKLFQVVRVGVRPLIALPCGSARVRHAAIRCYPSHSWKKVLVRFAISAVISSGLSRVLWKHSLLALDGPANGAFGPWLSAVRAGLGNPDLEPVVVWPARFSRGRIYVHLLDRQGIARAFAKLALDRENSELIGNEMRALNRLHSLKAKRSKVPRILCSVSFSGRASLIVESIPVDARITDWARDPSVNDCICEYSGETQTVPLGEILKLRWWRELQRTSGPIPAFAALVQEAAAGAVEVCQVHGDLNRTNVLRAGDAVWLLDWEQSCEMGPCLTDLICIDVDRRWQASSRDPATSFASFLKAEWEGRSPEHQRRVILALAFLYAASFPPASVLVQQWDQTLRKGRHRSLSAI